MADRMKSAVLRATIIVILAFTALILVPEAVAEQSGTFQGPGLPVASARRLISWRVARSAPSSWQEMLASRMNLVG